MLEICLLLSLLNLNPSAEDFYQIPFFGMHALYIYATLGRLSGPVPNSLCQPECQVGNRGQAIYSHIDAMLSICQAFPDTKETLADMTIQWQMHQPCMAARACMSDESSKNALLSTSHAQVPLSSFCSNVIADKIEWPQVMAHGQEVPRVDPNQQ